jgi:hypothetical protein
VVAATFFYKSNLSPLHIHKCEYNMYIQYNHILYLHYNHILKPPILCPSSVQIKGEADQVAIKRERI